MYESEGGWDHWLKGWANAKAILVLQRNIKGFSKTYSVDYGVVNHGYVQMVWTISPETRETKNGTKNKKKNSNIQPTYVISLKNKILVFCS